MSVTRRSPSRATHLIKQIPLSEMKNCFEVSRGDEKFSNDTYPLPPAWCFWREHQRGDVSASARLQSQRWAGEWVDDLALAVGGGGGACSRFSPLVSSHRLLFLRFFWLISKTYKYLTGAPKPVGYQWMQLSSWYFSESMKPHFRFWFNDLIGDLQQQWFSTVSWFCYYRILGSSRLKESAAESLFNHIGI